MFHPHAESLFSRLWLAHPGPSPAYPCDENTYENQCAIRMTVALEKAGISTQNFELSTSKYSKDGRCKFHHGHILLAQDIATNLAKPEYCARLGTTCEKLTGHIMNDVKDGRDNFDYFFENKGIVFIENGWGTTDHIDLYDGTKDGFEFRGSNSHLAYHFKGQRVWFWKMG